MRTAIWPMVLRAKRIGPAERLRAQQHVNAERPALPHQPVEQQRRLLRNPVVFDEQFLELVDDQQDPRQPGVGLLRAVAS